MPIGSTECRNVGSQHLLAGQEAAIWAVAMEPACACWIPRIGPATIGIFTAALSVPIWSQNDAGVAQIVRIMEFVRQADWFLVRHLQPEIYMTGQGGRIKPQLFNITPVEV